MDSKADKLHKKAIKEHQRRLKPGECEKYVRLVLDTEVVASGAMGEELLVELTNLQMKYEVRSLPVKNCIIWERQAAQRQLAVEDFGEAALTCEWQTENQVVQLITTDEVQQAVRYGTLDVIKQRLDLHFHDMRPTLAVLGKNDKLSTSNTITAALIELQLMQQVAALQVPATAREVGALLRRFTKAIAEAPYKQQKAETLGTFKKFLANDKKQCVRVVGTNGFGRLWQQHLNRLPLVTLEVAESIIAQYSCPKKLRSAFENEPSTATQVLADMKIKRAGPQALQSDRRIGNVLSGKLQLLYTSRDPNAVI